MSLINREELLATIMDDGGLQYPRWWYIGWYTDKIKTAPEAVVRCKDCKHYVPYQTKDGCFCFLDAGMCEAEPDDFCSRGVRKDD